MVVRIVWIVWVVGIVVIVHSREGCGCMEKGVSLNACVDDTPERWPGMKVSSAPDYYTLLTCRYAAIMLLS